MDATKALRGLPPELFLVHHGLPREGPGCDTATLRALRGLPEMPPSPRVFDLGCGPGAQTLVLARTVGARVVAADLHRPFLDQLERSARRAGLSELVETRCADFGALGEPPSSIELVWCESAAFIAFHRCAGQNRFRHHLGVTYAAVDGGRVLGFATVERL